MIRYVWAALLAGGVSLGVLGATSLRPLSETEQIDESQSIFRGRVERIEAARETTPAGTAIMTTVRVTPLEVYKGDVAGPVSLRFLGGKIGDVEMRVGGMPQFEVGQEYILFVSAAGNRACPVVGWSQGSLRVDRTANPAGEVADPAEEAASTSAANVAPRARRVLPDARMLPEFERRLRARIAERRNPSP